MQLSAFAPGGEGEVRGGMDTICAVSSGGVPSGVAVIRASGPRCRFVLETISGPLPAPRHAALRSIRDRNGEALDRGLVLWFPGPASFTGEDMFELQVHGSRAVISALLRLLCGFEGVRMAQAGEFTRRAFLAGRIDLTEAEGLADLLAAETEAQRRQAVIQAGGAQRRLYEGWRERLIRIRALVEADFDFAEEEDMPGSVAEAAWADAARLRDEIGAHLADGHRGERLRDGFQVVLLGRPNAGKSTLLNALARREVAIVAEEAGTTRDLIEVHLDLDGVPVTLVDTAGLREAGGRVEAEGMRRALARSAVADLVLWLHDAAGRTESDLPPDLPGTEVWEVRTKSDLVAEGSAVAEGIRFEFATKRLSISGVTGEGIGDLVAFLGAAARDRCGTGDGAGPNRERHRGHLERALTELNRAISGACGDEELRAEDLRRAGDEIGRITGAIGVEDLLDVIFREFCIGK